MTLPLYARLWNAAREAEQTDRERAARLRRLHHRAAMRPGSERKRMFGRKAVR